MTGLPTLDEVTFSARDIYERVVSAALNTPDMTGSCLYGSILLHAMVNRFAGRQATIRGGGPATGSGFRDRGGRLHGHYWVEVEPRGDDGWVLDITADQFGEASVIVWPQPIAKHRYRPGDQADVDEAVRFETSVIEGMAGKVGGTGSSEVGVSPA